MAETKLNGTQIVHFRICHLVCVLKCIRNMYRKSYWNSLRLFPDLKSDKINDVLYALFAFDTLFVCSVVVYGLYTCISMCAYIYANFFPSPIWFLLLLLPSSSSSSSFFLLLLLLRFFFAKLLLCLSNVLYWWIKALHRSTTCGISNW